MSPTFPDFIKSLGFERISGLLGLTQVAARNMRSRGYISRVHWPDLLLAVPELGLNDLLAMEKAYEELKRADAEQQAG